MFLWVFDCSRASSSRLVCHVSSSNQLRSSWVTSANWVRSSPFPLLLWFRLCSGADFALVPGGSQAREELIEHGSVTAEFVGGHSIGYGHKAPLCSPHSNLMGSSSADIGASFARMDVGVSGFSIKRWQSLEDDSVCALGRRHAPLPPA